MRLSLEVLIGVLCLAMLSASAFVLTQRGRTTVVEAADVLAEFRANNGVDADTSAAPDPAVPDPAAPNAGSARATTDIAAADGSASSPDVDEAEADGSSPTSDATPATNSQSDPDVQPSADTGPPSASPVLVLPDEGVYTYDTTGYESVSFGGSRHDYPDESYAVVEQTGGCGWEHDLRVVEEHREQRRFCTEGPELLGAGFTSWVTFFGQTEETNMDCDNRVMADLTHVRGEQWVTHCSNGEGRNSEEVVTYLGRETLTIAGQPVETMHYTMTSELSGDVQGGGTTHQWISVENGIWVKLVRDVVSRARAFGVGEVEYREEASFTLASMTPQR